MLRTSRRIFDTVLCRRQIHEFRVLPKTREILAGIREGNRARLAEAITLVESKNLEKSHQAQWLLTKLLSQRSKERQLGLLKPSFRIGLSGPPGAGKSTLIETFGQLLTRKGFKVGVLAVDPSSIRTGGAILGDKTRMVKLAADPNAYIRPSPSSGTLGGVTRGTNEAIVLCEGAGYDIVLVETVGVGQSEVAVSDMVDMFVLVLSPAGGDELQGMKKGIVEMADLIVINKADGDLLAPAIRMQTEYTSALKLIRKKSNLWTPQVWRISSTTKVGIEEMWNIIDNFWKTMEASGDIQRVRQGQSKKWLWSHINWELVKRFRMQPGLDEQIAEMEKMVVAGSLPAGSAAEILLDKFFAVRNTNAGQSRAPNCATMELNELLDQPPTAR